MYLLPNELRLNLSLIQGKKMEDEFSLFDYSVKVSSMLRNVVTNL